VNRTRVLGTTLLLVGFTAASPPAVLANGIGGPTVVEPPTRFEAFLASTTCVPCVQDAYAVGTVSVAPLRLPGFTGSMGSAMARAGEVRFEVLQAYPLGRAASSSWRRGARWFVSAGATPPYLFASGLVDEGDVGRLAAAVSAMASALASEPAGKPAADTTEMEVHAGSVRVGAIRTANATVACIQLADPRLVRPPWMMDAQGTLFLPAADLPRLLQVLEQVADRMEQLHGH
jgi:hypothetical protein